MHTLPPPNDPPLTNKVCWVLHGIQDVILSVKGTACSARCALSSSISLSFSCMDLGLFPAFDSCRITACCMWNVCWLASQNKYQNCNKLQMKRKAVGCCHHLWGHPCSTLLCKHLGGWSYYICQICLPHFLLPCKKKKHFQNCEHVTSCINMEMHATTFGYEKCPWSWPIWSFAEMMHPLVLKKMETQFIKWL